MDTQKKVKEVSRFIILIPHRDSVKPLEEYRGRLFTAGFPGAYSFPAAAPLAYVSRPFNREELKELARNIRELSAIQVSIQGKIQSSKTTLITFPGKFSFFGPLLDFPFNESLFPQTSKSKILEIPASPVLCAAIVSHGETPVYIDAPSLSFRAASLANLAIRSLAGGEADYSFEWKIGPPVWLPKYKGIRE